MLGHAAAPPASAFEEGATYPEEIDGLPVGSAEPSLVREMNEAGLDEILEELGDEPAAP